MQVSHAGVYVVVAQDVLYGEQVAAVLDHKRSRSMAKKHMRTALLRNPCASLVVDYQAVNVFAVEP